MFAAVGGLDHGALRESLADASWWWIAAGFVLAQLPRLTQAVSTLGSVPARIAFRPVYVMQLATGYMNLALPSSLARMAINIRFFQRQGIPPTAAVTAGAIDSFASTVIQAVLLVLLLLFSSASLDLDLDRRRATRCGSRRRRASIVVGSIAAVAARAAAPQPDRRRACAAGGPRCAAPCSGCAPSDKLGLLIGGSLATELLFATALGVFANALGYDVSLADLLVMNISRLAARQLRPDPGEHRRRRARAHRRARLRRDDRGGRARRGAALPRGDVLHPAGVGLLRDALAPAQRALL